MTSFAKNIAAMLLFIASAATISAQEDGKNVYDVKFAGLPADITSLPAAQPEAWNFNFRPYGSSDMLWTDPITRRDVTSGAVSGDSTPTALNVTCDENGFTILVLCVDPALAVTEISTNSIPASSPSLEFFFSPGDADTPKIEHYYQMFYADGRLQEFPWLVDTADFRPCLPYTAISEHVAKNAIIVKISVLWDPLFDRLPIFNGKRDNFWRLSMIRWGKLSQTWGGTVHQASQAGYLRWPEFTDAQKTSIMKGILRRGWLSFLKESGSHSMKITRDWYGVDPLKAKYREEEDAASPRSYINYNEDAGFRPILEKLTADCRALAPEIVGFEMKPIAEQEAFYKIASRKLFNFRYDVEAAYEKYIRDGLFK